MPELLEKIKKIKLMTQLITFISASGCIFGFLLFLILLVITSKLSIFRFDINISDWFSTEENQFSSLSDIDYRIEIVYENLKKEYGVEINGALIGATLQTALENNPDLNHVYIPHSLYRPSNISTETFPSKDLLLEMAEAMKVTETNYVCQVLAKVESEDLSSVEPKWVDVSTGSYIEELVGIVPNQQIETCEIDNLSNPRVRQVFEEDTYVISELYYTEVYLREFFAKDEITDLDENDPNYEALITRYIDQVLENYNSYVDIFYGSQRPTLFGLNFLASVPVIAKDGRSALPLTWGYPEYEHGANISSYFGWRKNPFGDGSKDYHEGLDLGCNNSNPAIYAMYPGVVRKTGFEVGGYGYYVILEHNSREETVYAHLFEIDVVEGQFLSAGDSLGLCGTTGLSTAPHLHLEYRLNGSRDNPLPKLEEILNKL